MSESKVRGVVHLIEEPKPTARKGSENGLSFGTEQ